MAKTTRAGAAAPAPPPAKAAVSEEEARIKALYSIMQSIEVRQRVAAAASQLA